MLTINEQAILAGQLVNELFVSSCPPVPEDATIENLWMEICILRNKIRKPKKVTAIQILLEDERLTGLTTALIADIIQSVFKLHSLDCNTSDNSIRWYISQKTLEWQIKPRLKEKTLAGITLECS